MSTSDTAIGLISAVDAIAARADLRFIFVGAGAEGERESFDLKHIPGAAFVGVRDAFAGPASPEKGSFPLPSTGQISTAMGAAGVGAGDRVVVYAAAPAWASRAWWVLRWAGVDARILDGGLAAWEQASGPVAGPEDTGPASVATLALAGGQAAQIDIDDLLASLGKRSIVDTRDSASFAAGHIPGAINIPAPGLWDGQGRLKDRDAVRAAFAAAGVTEGDEVIVSCGGGVLATYAALALETVGVRPVVYVGSWSQWAARADAPRQTGLAN